MTLASIVLTTTKLMRRSVPASVEPGLKPNQPKARMNVPTHDHRDVVAGNRLRLAVDVLADARTDDDAAGQGDDAAHRVHDAGAGEVDRTVAQAPVDAQLEPASRRPRPSWHRGSTGSATHKP